MVINNLEAFVVELNKHYEYVLSGEVIKEEFGEFYAIPIVRRKKVKKEEATPEKWTDFIREFTDFGEKVLKNFDIKEDESNRVVSQRKFSFTH